MKILYVTTISLTMNSFFKPHIEMLVREGHRVDLACNFSDLEPDKLYSELGCNFYQIDFSRSPLSSDNIRAYGQLKAAIENGGYDIVHCHTPNASVITRLVCRKLRKSKGLKVFYTAHGFHFYKGAPKLNWMVYYPVERFCSRFTDKLITINMEDYELAKSKFHAAEICYVPGVGVDFSLFENVQVDRKAKRQEIGVPESAVLLLSVGELHERKNHEVIIKALSVINNCDVHYAIAGDGEKKEYLLKLAQDLGVSDRVHLLGYRTDVVELNFISDVYCFPSLKEGLGIAAIEAMACGLPLISSDVQGINDYSVNGVTGYKCDPSDVEGFAKAVKKLTEDCDLRSGIGKENISIAKKYDIEQILLLLKREYLI